MGATELHWTQVGSIEVANFAEDNAAALAQVAAHSDLAWPWLAQLPEFGKWKGAEPIAIVAAGPSLRYTLHMLGAYRVVMIAGSAHDFAVSRGVRATYCVILDAAPEAANYLKVPSHACNYMLATQCHDSVLTALVNYPVTLWHCGGMPGVPETESTIGGGSTVGLRCIEIANRLGYTQMHFFGFDSCLDPATDAMHAFPLVDPSKEFCKGTAADILELRIDTEGDKGRRFRVPKYLVAQLWQFEEMLRKSGDAFTPYVHGDGAIAEMVRLYRERGE